jgi:uncharacterized protein (DUF1697 family)
MKSYVALLRAVNVGGTGKLPMATLHAVCEAAGFAKVKTYIASGNVVFMSRLGEAQVKRTLEAALAEYAGKHVDVLVRDLDEMTALVAANPFPNAPGNRVVAIFLQEPVTGTALEDVSNINGEQLSLGLRRKTSREIFVHYGDGMAGSKLKIAAASSGTARNMNTIATLTQMLSGLALKR